MFSIRPSKGVHYDSIYLAIEEPSSLIGKMNYRIYYDTSKTNGDFADDSPSLGTYRSVTGKSVYSLNGAIFSALGWYGKKIYFRVASQVDGFPRFSDKGEIDSGWTKLTTVVASSFDTIDVGDLDTAVLGFKWGAVPNAEEYIIERTRYNENSYQLLDTVSDSFYLDTIVLNMRNQAFLYRVKALNDLSMFAGSNGIENSDSKIFCFC